MNHHDGSAPSSLVQRAYDYLREGITSGALPSGSRLVTRTIAKEVGASLNPVREALGRLVSEGLVDHVPGAGHRVHQLTREEIIELYGVREAIEPYAAAEAARFAGDLEFEQLEAICDDWAHLAHQRRDQNTLDDEQCARWIANNERFRRVLVGAARNRFLWKCVTEFRVLGTIFDAHRRAHAVPSLSVAARTWRSHAKLVRLLQKRDAEAARALVLQQLRSGLRHTLFVFDRALEVTAVLGFA